jgi:histidine triad (HIT) family protein
MSVKVDENCIFCKIIVGTLPGAKVYEDADLLVFMNLQQKNPGHSLIIPKEHYANIYELPEDLAAKIAVMAKRLAVAVKKAFECDGVNILQNNEPAAMQSVFHFHTHVIPRYKGDDLLGIWASPAAKPDTLTANAEKLKAAL